jgi:hypothetical protein
MILQAISNYLKNNNIQNWPYTQYISIWHNTAKTTYIKHNTHDNTIQLTTYNHNHKLNLPYNETTLDLADPDLYPKILKILLHEHNIKILQIIQ